MSVFIERVETHFLLGLCKDKALHWSNLPSLHFHKLCFHPILPKALRRSNCSGSPVNLKGECGFFLYFGWKVCGIKLALLQTQLSQMDDI